MIPWLATHPVQFPDTRKALKEPNGLLAAGGDLSADTLLAAYHRGIFPWYQEPDPILWWSPDPRMVLDPREVHISSSMKKMLRKMPFTITCDQAFDKVMQACAGTRNYTDETWISTEIQRAYGALHEQGHAHSVEVWQEGRLIGGLYGVALGSVFFGESMFSQVANASKAGFITLCQVLGNCGVGLVDCQVYTPHLASLGAREIPRNEFERLLKVLTQQQPTGNPWTMLESSVVNTHHMPKA